MSNWQTSPEGGHMERPDGICYQKMMEKQIEDRLEANGLITIPIGSTAAHGPACPRQDVEAVLKDPKGPGARQLYTFAYPP